MLRRRDRSFSIFSMSALDLVAMSTGTFVLIVVILLPYYRKTFDAHAEMADTRAAMETVLAEADAVRRDAALETRAAAEARAAADRMLRGADEMEAAATSLRDDANAADGKAGDDDQKVREMRALIQQRVIPQLDLVIVIDTTASMGKVLRELSLSMAGLVRILERLVPSLRIGFVAYRDVDLPGWVVRDFTLQPTSVALDQILGFANELTAANVGGRTVDEDVYAGLLAALAMPFRSSARRTVIVVGDAAAHPHEQSAALSSARQFNNSGDASISTLFVSTESFRRFGRNDRHFFRDLARAGGGTFNQTGGQLIEGILLSVLVD